MALPATPADTATLAQAVAAGFWGKRTDPAPDQFYTAPGGAVGTPIRLTGVSPASGPRAGGTTITLAGTGLTAATLVTVGQAKATAVTVVNDGQATAVTPAGEGPGKTVAVGNDAYGKGTLAGAYSYT